MRCPHCGFRHITPVERCARCKKTIARAPGPPVENEFLGESSETSGSFALAEAAPPRSSQAEELLPPEPEAPAPEALSWSLAEREDASSMAAAEEDEEDFFRLLEIEEEGGRKEDPGKREETAGESSFLPAEGSPGGGDLDAFFRDAAEEQEDSLFSAEGLSSLEGVEERLEEVDEALATSVVPDETTEDLSPAEDSAAEFSSSNSGEASSAEENLVGRGGKIKEQDSLPEMPAFSEEEIILLLAQELTLPENKAGEAVRVTPGASEAKEESGGPAEDEASSLSPALAPEAVQVSLLDLLSDEICMRTGPADKVDALPREEKAAALPEERSYSNRNKGKGGKTPEPSLSSFRPSRRASFPPAWEEKEDRDMLEVFFERRISPAAAEEADENSLISIRPALPQRRNFLLPHEQPMSRVARIRGRLEQIVSPALERFRLLSPGQLSVAFPSRLSFRRAVAGGIDFLLWTAMSLTLFFLTLVAAGSPPTEVSAGQWFYFLILPLLLMGALLAFVYETLFIGLLGQTPGMMAVRLKMIPMDPELFTPGRVMLRAALLVGALVPLGLGLLLLRRPHPLPWVHDLLAGLQLRML